MLGRVNLGVVNGLYDGVMGVKREGGRERGRRRTEVTPLGTRVGEEDIELA